MTPAVKSRLYGAKQFKLVQQFQRATAPRGRLVPQGTDRHREQGVCAGKAGFCEAAPQHHELRNARQGNGLISTMQLLLPLITE